MTTMLAVVTTLKKWSAIVVLVSLSGAAWGQVGKTPEEVASRSRAPGVTGMQAQQISFDGAGRAVIRLTNISPKNISAYVFTYTAIYGNGSAVPTQRLRDFLPGILTQEEEGSTTDAGALFPGDTRDEAVVFEPLRGGIAATRVEVSVELTEYTDGTLEVSDLSARNEFHKMRASRAATLDEVTRILHAHSDRADKNTDEVAASITEINALLERTRQHATSLLDVELLSVLDDLQRIPRTSRDASEQALSTYLHRQEWRRDAMARRTAREAQQ